MLIAGILFLALCVLLLWFRRRKQNELLEIKSTPTARIGDLVRDCSEIREELGTSGGFLREVELSGTIQSSQLLNAPITGTPCCYYRTSVVREYEELVEVPDTDGAVRRETKRGSETVSSNAKTIPFQVMDASGSIRVNPSDATIEAVKTCDEFRVSGNRDTDIGFGAFRLSLTNLSQNPGRKTIGYRFQEWALPVETTVFIHGVAHDKDGDLQISLTGEEKGKFFISYKSEEDVIRDLGSTIRLLLIGVIACSILGFGLIIASVF